MKKNVLVLGILAAVFMVLGTATVAAQDAPASQVQFTVHVTYVTQGGTKKTDDVAVIAATPAEAESQAEAQFKAKNTRSTFVRAEAN